MAIKLVMLKICEGRAAFGRSPCHG